MTLPRFTLSVLVLLFACAPGGLRAQIIANPMLQVVSPASHVPEAWRADGQAERMAQDPAMRVEGRPARRVDYLGSAPYAGLVQRLDATAVRGQRLSLEGWVAKDHEAAAAGIWVRAFDAQRQSLAYANTDEHPLPADRQLRKQRLEAQWHAEAPGAEFAKTLIRLERPAHRNHGIPQRCQDEQHWLGMLAAGSNWRGWKARCQRRSRRR